MKQYAVLVDGWLIDGFGNGAYRIAGERVQFYPKQVEYLLGVNVSEIPAAPAKPEPKGK